MKVFSQSYTEKVFGMKTTFNPILRQPTSLAKTYLKSKKTFPKSISKLACTQTSGVNKIPKISIEIKKQNQQRSPTRKRRRVTNQNQYKKELNIQTSGVNKLVLYRSRRRNTDNLGWPKSDRLPSISSLDNAKLVKFLMWTHLPGRYTICNILTEKISPSLAYNHVIKPVGFYRLPSLLSGLKKRLWNETETIRR